MIFINLIIYTPLSLYLLSKRELHDFIDRNHFRDGLYLKRNRSSKQFIRMLYQFNSLSKLILFPIMRLKEVIINILLGSEKYYNVYQKAYIRNNLEEH